MPAERPLPLPDADSRPFWEAARQGRLLIQRCSGCGRHIFYPRRLCPHCFTPDPQWVEASGAGTVYSFTIVRYPAGEAFAADVPYVVAVVELAEGVRLVTNLVGCPPEAVRIGMPVRVLFRSVAPACTLPLFQPADA